MCWGVWAGRYRIQDPAGAVARMPGQLSCRACRPGGTFSIQTRHMPEEGRWPRGTLSRGTLRRAGGEFGRAGGGGGGGRSGSVVRGTGVGRAGGRRVGSGSLFSGAGSASSGCLMTTVQAPERRHRRPIEANRDIDIVAVSFVVGPQVRGCTGKVPWLMSQVDQGGRLGPEGGSGGQEIRGKSDSWVGTGSFTPEGRFHGRPRRGPRRRRRCSAGP
jgi:hypothetical protein